MAKPRFTQRYKLLLMAAGASALVLAGIVVGFVVLLSGVMTTAATKQHYTITHRILDLGLRYAVRTSSRDVIVPPLDDPRMIDQGLACYRRHCLACHGAPGLAQSEAGKGMLPIPSPLAQSAREWPAAWLYYVTKKGVRMTGMPAWEFRMSEESLWSTVAFLKTLPFLSEREYREMEAAVADEECTPRMQLSGLPGRERGDLLLRQYACHSCHRIEGVVGPHAHVGPEIIDWRSRKYIAGVIPNTFDNLTRWIIEPDALKPGTLMPDMGVPPAHAREMARFLLAPE